MLHDPLGKIICVSSIIRVVGRNAIYKPKNPFPALFALRPSISSQLRANGIEPTISKYESLKFQVFYPHETQEG